MQILWRKHSEDYSKAKLFPLKLLRAKQEETPYGDTLTLECINEELNAVRIFTESEFYTEGMTTSTPQEICFLFIAPDETVIEQVYILKPGGLSKTAQTYKKSFTAQCKPIISLTFELM
jgi:hypothetical protein